MTISKQKISLFFRLSISVTVFGALFTFLPSTLILIGAIGMVTFLSIQLYQKEERLALDFARLILIVLFLANYSVSIFNLPYEQLFTAFTKFALIAFLLLYIKQIVATFQENTQNNAFLIPNIATEQLSYILADLATVYIVIASLFKILHWNLGIINGNFLLILGLFSALISILVAPRNLEN